MFFEQKTMAVAPFHLGRVHVQQGDCALTDFESACAPLVATWVKDVRELFWLAPKTIPPLTADKVIGWPGPHGRPLLFWQLGRAEPTGYAELNPMPGNSAHLWIGHCLIRPDARGAGLGHRIVQLLIEEAFSRHRAPAVSLVVFPENSPAVRCYRANGFVHVREQVRFLPTTGRTYCMIEMRITRDDYTKNRTAAG